jgi:hypothetical protein
MPSVTRSTALALLAASVVAADPPPAYLSKEKAIEPPSYRAYLEKNLLITPADFGRMICIDGGELVISVYSEPTAKEVKDGKNFRITLTKSERGNLPSSKGDIKVTRIDADIDAGFATAIQQAWRAVLSKDPNVTGGPPPATLDGHVAYFSVTMPDGDTMLRMGGGLDALPETDMIDVGLAIAAYCDAPTEQRSKRREGIMNKLRRIVDKFDKA